MAHIVAFYSYKGGVGRSVILANTAAILAREGFKVVCIDFDLEAGGLHTIFGVKPEYTTLDILSTASSPPIGKVMMDLSDKLPNPKEEGGRLWLVPTVSETNKLNAAMEAQHDLSMILSNVVQVIEEHYNPHFILVDTRSGFAEIAAAPLRNADSLVVVLRPNRQNAEGLRFFLDIMSNVRNPPKALIVVSQVPTAENAKSKLRKLESGLGGRHKFNVLIPYDSDLALEEIVFPISSPDTEVIKYYQTIADWLKKRFKRATGESNEV